jgi:hypothetical protein
MGWGIRHQPSASITTSMRARRSAQRSQWLLVHASVSQMRGEELARDRCAMD